MQFYISLTEELSKDDKSGIAHFDGIGHVWLKMLNCHTLTGTIPGRFTVRLTKLLTNCFQSSLEIPEVRYELGYFIP